MSDSTSYLLHPPSEPGGTIPPDTDHSVSVSLPLWKHNVWYEMGIPEFLATFQTGYPRFLLNKYVKQLIEYVATVEHLNHSEDGETALLFPTMSVVNQCIEFVTTYGKLPAETLRVVDLKDVVAHDFGDLLDTKALNFSIYALIFRKADFPVVKQFWQHSGDGISSRRAEDALRILSDIRDRVNKRLVERSISHFKGKSRYSSKSDLQALNNCFQTDLKADEKKNLESDAALYLEERYARNMEASLAPAAKRVLRRRILGTLKDEVDLTKDIPETAVGETLRDVEGLTENDVYLFPAGMSAIYNAHRTIRLTFGNILKSVCFGWTYVDTMKVLEKFGPGSYFYGFNDEKRLDELEALLESGERVLCLFCEFPSNPLLNAPNLDRIRKLSEKYDFPVVVDETVGNFVNVEVLPMVDIVVSSLTKVFSGDSNVLSGSMVLNPHSRYYSKFKKTLDENYEDNLFDLDALTLERNSRDFEYRAKVINRNAEMIADLLHEHPKVKRVHYPKYNPSGPNFEARRTANGGYGGLLSVVFKNPDDAIKFYDTLKVAKGPSLGTNFTLASPYAVLAHFNELDWAEQAGGIDPHLVRISVGMEPEDHLLKVFEEALS